MRLINVNTFEQRDRFENNKTPPYAILSHRWGEHEVSYQAYMDALQADLSDKLSDSGTGQNAGSPRSLALAQARKAPLEWLWVDTCCIDKFDNNEFQQSD